MHKNSSTKKLRIIALVFAIMVYSNINANNNNNEGPTVYSNDPNAEGTPTSVPLDGGLGILLLGAAAFGIKKLRNKKA